MRKWAKLPEYFRNDEVRPYYDLLKRKWFYRFIKRIFDIFASFILMILLFVPSVIVGLVVTCTSKGGPLFLQVRAGRYGKPFKIIKFRSMTRNSEKNQHITSKDDERITKIGKFIRKTHIDEFPQLLNVFVGQMSFVGPRPEVIPVVITYNKEYFSTLLIRPGITARASIVFNDESNQINKTNAENEYLNVILPKKMTINLNEIRHCSLYNDLNILFKTVF